MGSLVKHTKRDRTLNNCKSCIIIQRDRKQYFTENQSNQSLKMIYPVSSLISILCLLPCLSSLPATSRLTQTATGGSEVVIPCSLQDTSITSSTACHWVKDGWMVELGGRFSLRS